MSTINKEPFIKKLLASCSDEELATLSTLVDGGGNQTPLRRTANPIATEAIPHITSDDMGIHLCNLTINYTNFLGYLVYTDDYCALISFTDAQVLKVFDLTESKVQPDTVDEAINILELRSALYETKGGSGGGGGSDIDPKEYYGVNTPEFCISHAWIGEPGEEEVGYKLYFDQDLSEIAGKEIIVRLVYEEDVDNYYLLDLGPATLKLSNSSDHFELYNSPYLSNKVEADIVDNQEEDGVYTLDIDSEYASYINVPSKGLFIHAFYGFTFSDSIGLDDLEFTLYLLSPYKEPYIEQDDSRTINDFFKDIVDNQFFSYVAAMMHREGSGGSSSIPVLEKIDTILHSDDFGGENFIVFWEYGGDSAWNHNRWMIYPDNDSITTIEENVTPIDQWYKWFD